MVLILAPDRLARHYAYQHVVVEELEHAGCTIRFVNGPFNDSPEERLVREVHGLFAEFERAALQERSRRGKLHAARKGQFFTGAGPYGYTYLKARDGQPGRCVVNEAEAVVVRQMFTWLVEEQLSTQAIARRLTAQHVLPRRGQVPWSPATVYKILNNRAYTGTHHYNRSMNAPEGPREGSAGRPTKDPRRCLRPAEEWIAVPWTALVSEELFALAQRQLQLNRERSPRKTRLEYLLAGLLYCGHCGRRLGGHAGVASGRYECTRRRSIEPPEHRCHLRSLSQPDIEPVVWDHVAQLLQRPDLILAYLRQQGEGPDLTDSQHELKRLQRQRTALAREEQRLIDAYQVGVLELEELKGRRQRLREAGQQVEQREQIVTAQLVQAHQAIRLEDLVRTCCERLRAQLIEPSFELKRRILRLVTERIVVTDEEIVIHHIIPRDDTNRLCLRPSGSRQSVGRRGTGATLGGGTPSPPGGAGGTGVLPGYAAHTAPRSRAVRSTERSRPAAPGALGGVTASPRPSRRSFSAA